MSWWKQALLCLLILVVSAAIAYRYFPAAREMAAQWGLVETPAAAAISENGSQRPARGFGGLQSPIVTAAVTKARINDSLTAIGTGNALRTVAVRPYEAGRLVEIAVEAGEIVEAGDIIARMDSESESIAVDRAELALDDARARLTRIEALRSSNTVTAVQQTDAELAVRNAELELRDARLTLERRRVVAPIGGYVGILPVSEGSYVTSSDTVATIDDRSQILVDFWVPERYARALAVGMTFRAQSIARPDETYTGTVRAVDNQVDPDSRTLHIQGRIDNPGDVLRSGMAFRVGMSFPGDTYPAVNPLAIQWGTDGAYVWAVRGGVAQRLPVQIIQRNSDSILVDGELEEGEEVVVEGVHAVREGIPIAGNDDTSAAQGS